MEPQQGKLERGIVYTVTGEKFIQEAIRAARVTRKTNPGLPICLIADRDPGESVFDHVIVLEQPRRSIADKLQMDRAPYEKCLFLDSDTIVFNDLSEVFEMLDRFDLVFRQSSSGYHYKLPEVPHAFAEPNTGVIGWRRSAGSAAFFERWRQLYEQYEAVMGREWDQRSFRHAAYESPLRLGVLMHEYNFMPYSPVMACAKVVIMHGRPYEEMEKVERVVNSCEGFRAYVPKVGVVRHHTRQSVAQLLRISLQYQILAGLHVLRAVRGLFRKRKD